MLALEFAPGGGPYRDARELYRLNASNAESNANTGAQKKGGFRVTPWGPPSRTAIVRMKCAEQRLTYEGSSPSGGKHRRTTRPFPVAIQQYHEAR